MTNEQPKIIYYDDEITINQSRKVGRRVHVAVLKAIEKLIDNKIMDELTKNK